MNASTEYERLARTAEKSQRGIAVARNVADNAIAMQQSEERQAFPSERAAVEAAETRRQELQATFEQACTDRVEISASTYIELITPLIDAIDSELFPTATEALQTIRHGFAVDYGMSASETDAYMATFGYAAAVRELGEVAK